MDGSTVVPRGDTAPIAGCGEVGGGCGTGHGVDARCGARACRVSRRLGGVGVGPAMGRARGPDRALDRLPRIQGLAMVETSCCSGRGEGRGCRVSGQCRFGRGDACGRAGHGPHGARGSQRGGHRPVWSCKGRAACRSARRRDKAQNGRTWHGANPACELHERRTKKHHGTAVGPLPHSEIQRCIARHVCGGRKGPTRHPPSVGQSGGIGWAD